MIGSLQYPQGQDQGQQQREFRVTVKRDQIVYPQQVNRIEVEGPAKAWAFTNKKRSPTVIPISGPYQSQHVYIRSLRDHPIIVKKGEAVGQGREDVSEKPPPTQEELQKLWDRLRLPENEVIQKHPAAGKKLRERVKERCASRKSSQSSWWAHRGCHR